jgi:hypothetical protein
VSIEQGFRYNASTAYIERRAGLYRSNDKGASWRLMSDWNPRPMYASQPVVDPSDDRRIYMMNSYSYSDNGGESFTTPRQWGRPFRLGQPERLAPCHQAR